MQTELHIDGVHVKFERDWFFGTIRYTMNGKTKTLVSPFNPLTHIWFTLKRTYKLQINTKEMEIRHTRPLLFSFAKPHLYEFFVDDILIHKIEE